MHTATGDIEINYRHCGRCSDARRAGSHAIVAAITEAKVMFSLTVEFIRPHW